MIGVKVQAKLFKPDTKKNKITFDYKHKHRVQEPQLLCLLHLTSESTPLPLHTSLQLSESLGLPDVGIDLVPCIIEHLGGFALSREVGGIPEEEGIVV